MARTPGQARRRHPPFVKLAKVPQILAGSSPNSKTLRPISVRTLPSRCAALSRAAASCRVLGFGSPSSWPSSSSPWGFGSMTGSCACTFPAGYVTMDVYGLCNSICMICYVLAVVITIVSAIGAVLWALSSSFAFNRRFMQVTNGGFSTSTVTFPRQKIQYGYTKTNPLQRMAHTVTIKARRAAGVGGTTYALSM